MYNSFINDFGCDDMRQIFVMACMAMMSLLMACSSNQLLIDQSHRSLGQSLRIEYIIVHYTAENDANSLAVLTKGQVSSHYLIPSDHNPVIYQLVDDDKKAWHAGNSQFHGKTALNNISLGIEIVNAGILPEYLTHRGYRPQSHFVAYQAGQIDKVGRLLQQLSKKYAIAPQNILAHSDISPSRKIDPGAKFPWQFLYQTYGVGAWYDEQDKQDFMRQLDEYPQDLDDIAKIKQEFRHYGYAMNQTEEWDRASQDVIYAFQLHFRPQNPTGVLDIETLAILRALNKKYQKLP